MAERYRDVHIFRESPTADDVVALLTQHLAFNRSLSPEEHVHALDIDGLDQPDIAFFAARGEPEGTGEGELLGVGAVRLLGAGRAEIKSMHTAAAARGRGIGKQMVEHLIGFARTEGIGWLGLETGTMEAFAPARRLYGSLGFQECSPFGDYTVNPFSICMSLSLAAGETTTRLAP